VVSVPETTRWEELLREDTAAFLDNIKSFIKTACAGSTFDKIERKKESLGNCPACKGEVYEGKTNYYCSNYKEKSCPFRIWKESYGAAFTPEDAKLLLLGKPTKVKKAKNKAGKDYEARFALNGTELKPQFEERNNERGRK
jgi:DNA topoisomerase-3